VRETQGLTRPGAQAHPPLVIIQLDLTQFRSWSAALDRVNTRGMPFAARQTLNDAAANTRLRAREEIEKRMILRNHWTKGGIAFERARGVVTSAMQSEVGALARKSSLPREPGRQTYLATQEFGGVERAKEGSTGVSIPTAWASRESSLPRRRLALKRRSPRGMTLGSEWRGKTEKQRKFLKVAQSIKSGKRSIYMEHNGKRGLFRVVGGTRKNPGSARLRLAQDLSRDSVRIPRNPWLSPATEKTLTALPDLYARAVRAQIRLAMARINKGGA